MPFPNVNQVLLSQFRVREQRSHQLRDLLRREIDEVAVVEQEQDVRLSGGTILVVSWLDILVSDRKGSRTNHGGLE